MICKTPGCDNDVTKYTKARLCNQCYSYFYRWERKTDKQRCEQIERYEKWTKRLKYIPRRVLRIVSARKAKAA